MHATVNMCFKKEDALNQHPFAVKISRESDEEKKMAHIKEYEITSNLNHKNIVRSIDFFDDEIKGEIYQVMELIDGKEVLDSIAD
jgi:serine/threonine protein kinase